MKIEYLCECGRIFTNPNIFNNHKSNCKIHYLSKYGDLNKFNDKNKKSAITRSKILSDRANITKELKNQEWISEKHTCEKCGKVMTEKFGSGRFCSRKCSNSRLRTDEVKKLISNGVKRAIHNDEIKSIHRKNIDHQRHLKYLNDYNSSPNLCKVCGRTLPYEKRYRKTCSKECRSMLNSLNGGFKEGSVKNHKYGYYKGIRCDSSWELAFLVYHIENDIPVIRNSDCFEYIYAGEKHKYYPDFILNDTYIEIKNYITPQVEAKIEYFPKNLNYKILLYQDIKVYINYCVEHYGKKYWETLYD